jgi:hypothetical protein
LLLSLHTLRHCDISHRSFASDVGLQFGERFAALRNVVIEASWDGGSGSFGLEFRRLSTDVAIVAV